jgi:hypothetical protein
LIGNKSQYEKLLAERSTFSSFAAVGGSNMKWLREIDYHGSRAYGAEEPAFRRLGPGIGKVVNLARRAIGKLGRQPEPPMVLLHDGQHSFSLLGLDSPAGSRAKAAECPFPVKADVHDYRSYRVFP